MKNNNQNLTDAERKIIRSSIVSRPARDMAFGRIVGWLVVFGVVAWLLGTYLTNRR